MPDVEIEAFLSLYRRYRSGPSKISDWDSIRMPDADGLVPYDSFPVPDRKGTRAALSRLAVCKLNGGLGTSMGCPGAKSLIVVKEGKTFLDLILEQLREIRAVHGVDVPLVLMNSFYTQEETQKTLDGHRYRSFVEGFQQSKFPRFREDNGALLDAREYGREAWYPPGHGDIFHCLQNRGALEKLLNAGKNILFVSNADNLGAEVDARILSHMLEEDIPFLMEVTQKTLADVKGGVLYHDGSRLRLLEIARVPDERLEDFYNLEKFRFFNTNNIWINLAHLRKRLDEGPLDLEVIVNRKTVAGIDVVQLETAIGSGLDHFPAARGALVGRERFLPVKKTDDLLLVQSDLFKLEGGRLVRNPARTKSGLPQVKLGKSFARLEDYFARFRSIPNILDLDSLTLDGEVRFEENVTLRGNVSIVSHNAHMTIPKGSVLENCLVEN
ncbi:MAG: UTP--glucose-1-phosphate uridylyltransferase [Nitrospinae bacterium]|nr:UTP--glucose-1-phosphate uridylyltransferase [Nitrospinota bacterium]